MIHGPRRLVLLATWLATVACPVLAQRQFVDLSKRGLPAETDRARATALGDVDGDGDLDLIVANSLGPCRLCRNDGLGVFTSDLAALPVITNLVRSVELGDLDGDGDLDLVMGALSSTNFVLQNDGHGVFTDVTATALPSPMVDTNSVALGDVDGDGDLDLVTGTFGQFPGQESRLYLNDGSGRFTDVTATQMPPGFYRTNAVGLGDVDGDGDLDLVLGNESQQTRLYRNNGAGVFTDVTAASLPVAIDIVRALAFGDVDGDGDLDLVLGLSGTSGWLYSNNGAGVFTDVTATNLPTAFRLTSAVEFGDLDGDGDLDLVLTEDPNTSRQSIAVFRNGGNGVFTDVTAASVHSGFDRSSAVAIGDVDGDGDLDLVVGNAAQDRLFLNDGAAMFADATASRMPAGTYRTAALAVGDLDRDGNLDLVLGNNDDGSRLYLGDRGGNFTDATSLLPPTRLRSTTAVALGDVDGDGDLDLALGNTDRFGTGQQNLLFRNNGAGSFTDVTLTSLPAVLDLTTSLAFGDFDGDGDLDLVVGNGDPTGQQNRLHLNDGTGSFVEATNRLPVDNDPTSSLAVGDVDGDGDLDIVVGNDLRQNRLYLNDGTAHFTDVTAARLPAATFFTVAVALGDVDGDGDLDLVVGNRGHRNQLWLNNGTGTFVDATAARMPVATHTTMAVALGDVDGDGDLDIVFGNDGEPGLLYLNDGSGTFTDVGAVRLPLGLLRTFAVALADADRDGDLDLFTGNFGGQSQLVVNLLRQIDAPFVLRVGGSYRLDAHTHYGPASLVDFALPYFATVTADVLVPPFGVVGIDPATMIPLPPLLVPQPAGVGSLTVLVPPTPALGGITFHTQALLVNYPSLERLTNVVTDVMLR